MVNVDEKVDIVSNKVNKVTKNHQSIIQKKHYLELWKLAVRA